jgi:signal peptidase II
MFDKTKKVIMGLTIIIFFILDRFFKVLAVGYYHELPLTLAGDLFKFSFSQNYNIAFSLPVSGWWLNWLIILIILSLLFYFIYIVKKKDCHKALFLLFIVLGAASNLYDRLVYSYVIDYFDLKYFTVFNLADIMIVGGVAGTIFLLIVDRKEKLK